MEAYKSWPAEHEASAEYLRQDLSRTLAKKVSSSNRIELDNGNISTLLTSSDQELLAFAIDYSPADQTYDIFPSNLNPYQPANTGLPDFYKVSTHGATSYSSGEQGSPTHQEMASLLYKLKKSHAIPGVLSEDISDMDLPSSVTLKNLSTAVNRLSRLNNTSRSLVSSNRYTGRQFNFSDHHNNLPSKGIALGYYQKAYNQTSKILGDLKNDHPLYGKNQAALRIIDQSDSTREQITDYFIIESDRNYKLLKANREDSQLTYIEPNVSDEADDYQFVSDKETNQILCLVHQIIDNPAESQMTLQKWPDIKPLALYPRWRAQQKIAQTTRFLNDLFPDNF